MDNSYKDFWQPIDFKSEDDFRSKLAEYYGQCQNGVIVFYYGIGQQINHHYRDRTIGKTEIERVSSWMGASDSTVRKMLKFAKEYNPEHVEALLKGNGRFPFAWRHIAQNLSLSASVVISEYQAAECVSDFCNAVTRRKKGEESDTSDDKDGKASPDESSNEAGGSSEGADETSDADSTTEEAPSLEEENRRLREENERLRAVLVEKELLISELKRQLPS